MEGRDYDGDEDEKDLAKGSWGVGEVGFCFMFWLEYDAPLFVKRKVSLFEGERERDVIEWESYDQTVSVCVTMWKRKKCELTAFNNHGFQKLTFLFYLS